MSFYFNPMENASPCPEENDGGERPSLGMRIKSMWAVCIAAYSLLWPVLLCTIGGAVLACVVVLQLLR